MKRKILATIFLLLLAFCLTACGCEHVWEEATCLVPKTCKECGETEGEPMGHTWEEAGCTTPKTCKSCGETEGEALGHTWAEATCTEAKTCTVCTKKEGKALGHQTESWNLDKASTCSELGSESSVCGACGETVTREVAMLEHTPGQWTVTDEATAAKDGTEKQFCTVCEAEVDSRSYELPPFDYAQLKNKWRFSYDEFDKSWKYLAQYDKSYSNADEFVNIIVFSEDGGARVSDFEIRAGLSWKGVDKDREQWVVEGLEILVNEKVYSFSMSESSYKTFSLSVLASDTSYQFLQDLASANKLKLKIFYDGHGTTELDLGSNPFQTFCKDIITYKVWDYYAPSFSLLTSDTTTVR